MQPPFPASGLHSCPSNHHPGSAYIPAAHREWSVTTPDDNSLLHSSVSFSTAIPKQPPIERVKLVTLGHSGRRRRRQIGRGKDRLACSASLGRDANYRGPLHPLRRDWARRSSRTSASYLGDVGHPDASYSPTHIHHSEIQQSLPLTTSPHLVARHGSRGAPSEDTVRCVCFCRSSVPKFLLRGPLAFPLRATSLMTPCVLVSMFS